MPLVEHVTSLRRTMHRHLMRRLAAATDRSLLHLRALRVIAIGEAATQSEVAEALLVDPAAVSRLVDRLVDDRLLLRREGKDRRCVRLELTKEGEAELAKLTAELARIDRQARRHLSAQELKALLALMDKLHAGLSSEGDETDAD